jgi:phage portal protein BeeE
MTVRFSTKELLRLAEKARYEVYKTGIDAGIFDADEARASEGMPPRQSGMVPPELQPTPSTPAPPRLEAPNA